MKRPTSPQPKSQDCLIPRSSSTSTEPGYGKHVEPIKSPKLQPNQLQLFILHTILPHYFPFIP
jgi:hypothetical protein